MNVLVFDTETTGIVDFKAPSNAPHQPQLVQLGAQLLDRETWTVRAEVNLIIKPDGWEIPKGAADVHGITTEIAARFGVDRKIALAAFHGLASIADLFVAHNYDFDGAIMATSYDREKRGDKWDALKSEAFCTMRAMTPVCQIPGKYDEFKWPKLIEAYRHCFQETFDGAHDAMADVRACARVFRWLKERPI